MNFQSIILVCLFISLHALSVLGASSPFLIPRLQFQELLFEKSAQEQGLKIANKMGLEANKDVKEALNRTLYLETLKQLKKKSPVNENTLKAYYNSYPLFHLRHIALQKSKVNAVELEKLKSEFKKQAFVKVALKWVPDSASNFGGEMEFRGPHNMPSEIYSEVLSLKPNQTSNPIEVNEGIHFVQLIEKHSYLDAPESYKALLRSNLETSLLLEMLQKGG